MQLRDELRLGLATLILVQIATVGGAVGLLGRMSPAIGRILDENVESLEAVAQMELALAAPRSRGALDRFHQALERAEANITEPEEVPILTGLRAQGDQALQGDDAALDQVLVGLSELGQINTRSMHEADQEARRLGAAGAWAIVGLGGFGLAATWLLSRRLSGRLAAPLREVEATLDAWSAGDTRRRCSLQGAPTEVARIAEQLNAVLDHSSVAPAAPVLHADRSALLFLLDQDPRPVIVLDPQGKLLATNAAALELPGGPRHDLLNHPDSWSSQPFLGGALRRKL